uniref:Ig-like domain-containing protein n=1 Tax=Trichuris muris TaxID=70415 RepID=A0A5S6R5E6_TRIMR
MRCSQETRGDFLIKSDWQLLGQRREPRRRPEVPALAKVQPVAGPPKRGERLSEQWGGGDGGTGNSITVGKAKCPTTRAAPLAVHWSKTGSTDSPATDPADREQRHSRWTIDFLIAAAHRLTVVCDPIRVGRLWSTTASSHTWRKDVQKGRGSQRAFATRLAEAPVQVIHTLS